jgi:hypothetical protein
MADMDGPASERDLIVTLEARVEKLTKAKDEQKHRARKAERKVTRLREALKGLASGPYGGPPLLVRDAGGQPDGEIPQRCLPRRPCRTTPEERK